MGDLWNWLIQNKQWVFSGAGLTVLGLAVWLLRKLLSPRRQTSAAPPITQAATINVSPTFNLSEGTTLIPIAQRSQLGVAAAKEENEDRRPKLYTLPPRICPISTPEDGMGFIESYETSPFKAVLAVFRMRKPSADSHDTQVVAQLSYRTVTDDGLREISKEIRRVNYGMWIHEDFNSVEMTLTDTKELVLVVQGEGHCAAIQDNRHSVSKRSEPTVYVFDSDLHEFYVDVTLVDDHHGSLVTYTYKVETDPLRVHEIIRVPSSW